MFSSSEKTNRPAASVQRKSGDIVFFRKAGDETFFGAKETPSFFSAPVQAKLSVSSPDDPQEKEADAMADHVMRMPEPAAAPPEKKEEEKLQRKEDEEQVQAKPGVAVINKIQCKEKEEEKVQTKLYNTLQRSRDETNETAIADPDTVSRNDHSINRKNISLHHSDVIQRSGRGPPTDSIPFEQSLSSSKGGGSALPGDTRQFMESRFQADFSGVHIHTGSYAESMSSQINAQAFTHGNDIYFNSGKYSPHTEGGSVLLAHELTHTIQQGASKPVSSSPGSASAGTSVSVKSVCLSRKKIIHRTTDAVHAELPGVVPTTKSTEERMNGPALTATGSLITGNTRFNLKPKTFEELRRELFNVNRKEENDKEEVEQNEENSIQKKPELSNWQVDGGGNLQTSHSDSVNIHNDKKFQPKEEEEKKEEDDKQELTNQPSVQKKHDYGIQCKCNECSNEKVNIQPEYSVQRKAEITDSSLNYESDGSTSLMSNEKDRGPPPVQLKLNTGTAIIQRSWLSNAWNAVSSFVGEAAQVVARGIDAAKEWILRRIRTFVQNIPGYNILALILQHDPVTHEPVERTGRNILLAGLQLIPGGSLFQQVLDRIGAINEAAAWIETRISDLLSIVSGIGNRFTQFMDSLSLNDIGNPEGVLNRVAELFRGIFNDVTGFMTRAAVDFLAMIKRIMLRLIVDFVRERIPRLYPLLRVALGHDPVTGEEVPRNGHNILYAALDATDSGREQRRQMEETGSFDRVAAWIDRGIRVFSTAYDLLRQAFTNLWSAVTIENLFSPVETFTRIYNDFAAPITLVRNFLRDLAIEIIRLIKEALLRRLRDYARTVRGYFLVTVIIGSDPFTHEVVPRTIPNIIRGFMSLMEGGEEQYRQMEESGAIARTTQRIEAAVARLNMTPASIIRLFINLWNSFGLNDLAHPIDAFMRIVRTFGEPIGRLINFVIEIVKIVVHVILEIMNFPFDLINNIIAKAMLAFELIKRDPIGFLKNLLRAIKEGFMQFFDNILTHLFKGLKAWFLSEVQAAGMPIPTDFSVMGIIKWLLAVLDVTMEKIWKKLEDRIGKPKVDKIKRMIDVAERVASAAGEAYAFMQDVQQRGFMAVMIDKVKEQLSNVWELVLDAVKSFVMDQIVKKVTAKLLSMLDPTGIMAVVNSAIALYKAIQSFIRYLRQMLEIVNSFVEGTLQIAQGATKKAADFLEGALARSIPIVIGFLANQVGLNLSERLKDALELVREKVDKGLTWVIDKLVTIIEKLVSLGKAAVGKVLSWLGLRKEFTMENGNKHSLALAKSGSKAQLMIESTPMPLLTFINQFATQPNLPANKVQAANDARTYATTQVTPMLEQLSAAPEGTDTTALEKQLLDEMVELTNKIRLLVGETELLSDHVDKYLLEGAAGTFASMPKPTRDDMTPDHIPQNGVFEVAMGLGIFNPGSPMAIHAEQRTVAGYAMNEQANRHKAGRTFGGKGGATKSKFRTKVNAEIVTKTNDQEKKNAVVEAMKTEKNLDIGAMQSIYGKDINDAVWQDVKNLPLKQEDKISLQTKIRSQATAGLSLLNSQNLDALKA